MSDLSSSSDDSDDLASMMSYGLRTMQDIRDRQNDLKEVIKAMATKLQIEHLHIEKVMRLVSVCRLDR